MKIYAMSDIHGCYGEFLDALNLIDLSDKKNKLILLGDYIHGGDNSYQVIDKNYKILNASQGCHDFSMVIVAMRTKNRARKCFNQHFLNKR